MASGSSAYEFNTVFVVNTPHGEILTADINSFSTTSELPVSELLSCSQPKKLNAKRAFAINNNFFLFFTPNL